MFLRPFIATLLLSAAAAAGSKPVCPGPAAFGTVRCHSHVVTDKQGNPHASGGPSGYGPAQFQTAYSLPSSTSGIGQTIGIVDAFDDPNARGGVPGGRSGHVGSGPGEGHDDDQECCDE